MKTRDEIRDDLPLYALDALPAEERAAVEAALAGDAALARELREWRELVGLMALEAPAAPPPELKARLLARVRNEATAAPRKVARRRLGGLTLALATAALVLLAIATSLELDLRAERRQAQDVIAALRENLQAARGELASAQGELAKTTASLAALESDAAALRLALARAEAALSVVQQPDLQMVALKESKDAPPAAGHLLLSAPAGRALFYAFDLPRVADDKVYELWWITEKDGPVRAAIFQPDERGIGRAEAAVPAGAGAIQAAAVTVERAGGVAKPEGPMVLLGAFNKS